MIVVTDYIVYNEGFKTYLSVWLNEELAKRRFDIISLAIALSKTLNTNIVIDDESINPYTWILINPVGKVYKATEAKNVMESNFNAGLMIDFDNLIEFK